MNEVNNLRKIRNGTYHGEPGTYWAWQQDGYWDLHHSYPGEEPTGDDVIAEFFQTLTEVRAEVKTIMWLEQYL